MKPGAAGWGPTVPVKPEFHQKEGGMPEIPDWLPQRVDDLLAELEPDDGDPALQRLRALRQLRHTLAAIEAHALHQARAAEHDWADIGTALGMSGQAAGKRFRQHHQLTDPRLDTTTRRPRTRGPYHQRRTGPQQN